MVFRRKDVKSRGQGLGNRPTPPPEWKLDRVTETFNVQLPIWESEGNIRQMHNLEELIMRILQTSRPLSKSTGKN